MNVAEGQNAHTYLPQSRAPYEFRLSAAMAGPAVRL
jgi:hypothetical protein